LYNSPRAATVKARTNCILWLLDRETFNHIVKDAAQRKRDKYEDFLKSVEILSTVEPYELTQISDALKSATFNTGDYIIKEGEMGDVFYIIEEGHAVATKTFEPGM
jgi:cAMP-dependent protein kinase regulator